MKENIIKNKFFDLALRIIKLYKFLCEEKREFVISKQLLRSGTAVGALVWESEQAESKSVPIAIGIIHKMSIALKEANESDYWIELLFQSNYLDKTAYESIKQDLLEVLKLLVSIIKSSKLNRSK